MFVCIRVCLCRYALVTNFGKLTGILTKIDLFDVMTSIRENDGKLKERDVRTQVPLPLYVAPSMPHYDEAHNINQAPPEKRQQR